MTKDNSYTGLLVFLVLFVFTFILTYSFWETYARTKKCEQYAKLRCTPYVYYDYKAFKYVICETPEGMIKRDWFVEESK